MVAPSPVPRRVKSPSWLDVRLVLGIALVLGSVVAGAIVVSSADHSRRMLAVSRDLAAGTVLGADDLTTVSARVPDSERYVASGSDVIGRQLTRPVAAGELLPAAALVAPPTLTTVTIPFAEGQAPRLRSGQRIEVWLTTKACASVVLLSDATVQDVDQAGGSSFTSGAGQNVTLSLPPELAGRVVTALAFEGASIRAGILSGPQQAQQSLPSFDDCATASP